MFETKRVFQICWEVFMRSTFHDHKESTRQSRYIVINRPSKIYKRTIDSDTSAMLPRSHHFIQYMLYYLECLVRLLWMLMIWDVQHVVLRHTKSQWMSKCEVRVLIELGVRKCTESMAWNDERQRSLIPDGLSPNICHHQYDDATACCCGTECHTLGRRHWSYMLSFWQTSLLNLFRERT